MGSYGENDLLVMKTDNNDAHALPALSMEEGRKKRAWTVVDLIASGRSKQNSNAGQGNNIHLDTLLDPETKTIPGDLLHKYLEMANEVEDTSLSRVPEEAVRETEITVEINVRASIAEKKNTWSKIIGSRYSHQRGLCQLWSWVLIGIVILFMTAVNVSTLSRGDILHLGAFKGYDWALGGPFSYLNIKDEVDFTLEYEIIGLSETITFQVLLMDYVNFNLWRNGSTFTFVEKASFFTGTTSACLEPVFVDGIRDQIYVLVVMPCLMRSGDVGIVNFCGSNPLPAALGKGNKIYRQFRVPDSASSEEEDVAIIPLSSYRILPTPQSCSHSGSKGFLFLFIFLPYVIVLIYALKVPHMLFFKSSLHGIVQKQFEKENGVPENEVDYWQPLPWDRKTPKIRLCGPCCFIKMVSAF